MIEDLTPIFDSNEPTKSISREPFFSDEPQLTVKDFAKEDQPRERALELGVQSLRLSELFAIILRTGMPGLPITKLCKELLKQNDNNLHILERRSLEELMECPGIGQTKGIQILAVMELIRRYTEETPALMPSGGSPEQLASVIRPKIGNLDHEEIWAIFLNRANKITRLHRLSSGGIAASVFDVKMLMKRALLDQANAMVLCHNHPSGKLQPSPEDDHITRLCKNACEALTIRFLDHLIVSAHSHYSYYDNGRL